MVISYSSIHTKKLRSDAKMRVNEIVIGRKFNLGNYESLEVRVSVSPDDGDFTTDAEAYQKVVHKIATELNIEIKKLGVSLK